MPTPNYKFEQRRRELDKKAKKEEKRRNKLVADRSAPAADGTAAAEPVEPKPDATA